MSQVHITWDRRPRLPAADRLRRVALEALSRVGRVDVEVNVLVSGDATLRDLNLRFRGKDEATDVLSFPDGEPQPDGQTLLGEIAISLDRAREQAAALGHDEVRELEELVLHGVLHLDGYDHEVDDGEMDALEITLRKELLK